MVLPYNGTGGGEVGDSLQENADLDQCRTRDKPASISDWRSLNEDHPDYWDVPLSHVKYLAKDDPRQILGDKYETFYNRQGLGVSTPNVLLSALPDFPNSPTLPASGMHDWIKGDCEDIDAAERGDLPIGDMESWAPPSLNLKTTNEPSPPSYVEAFSHGAKQSIRRASTVTRSMTNVLGFKTEAKKDLEMQELGAQLEPSCGEICCLRLLQVVLAPFGLVAGLLACVLGGVFGIMWYTCLRQNDEAAAVIGAFIVGLLVLIFLPIIIPMLCLMCCFGRVFTLLQESMGMGEGFDDW